MRFSDRPGAEQRQIKRWYLVLYLRVYNQDDQALLGHIVDINKQGMRLVSDHPIPVNQIFRLWVDVPRKGGSRQRIPLEAESLWGGQDINPDFYDTGFRIQNIDMQTLLQMQLLIDEFKF